MSFDIYDTNIDTEKYFFVSYEMESTESLSKAAHDLAMGQSMGNPNVRNSWETDEMFEKHSCRIHYMKNYTLKSGIVTIAFPTINISWEGDGISQLLCHILGGQMDIDHITKCRVIGVDFPESVENRFKKSNFGFSGMRTFTDQWNKPFLGAIIKPKTGLTPAQLLEMVKQLVEGGVDFIKEDEILSNPTFCPLLSRVQILTPYLKGRKVIYCYCINGDPHVIVDRASMVQDWGGNGVHINFWSGLGSYHSIRKKTDLFIHFQKSGDKVITDNRNPFGMTWSVMAELAALMGVDSIHAGMFGGYHSDDENELNGIIHKMVKKNVIPILSCGMQPGLVDMTTKHFGVDYMANVGGAIHGHPGGTLAGVKAMRQAIDGNYGKEYGEAIKKWGYQQ